MKGELEAKGIPDENKIPIEKKVFSGAKVKNFDQIKEGISEKLPPPNVRNGACCNNCQNASERDLHNIYCRIFLVLMKKYVVYDAFQMKKLSSTAARKTILKEIRKFEERENNFV